MAGGVNKVFLMGNLTRDVELKHTPSDQPVASFGIASTQRKRLGRLLGSNFFRSAALSSATSQEAGITAANNWLPRPSSTGTATTATSSTPDC